MHLGCDPLGNVLADVLGRALGYAIGAASARRMFGEGFHELSTAESQLVIEALVFAATRRDGRPGPIEPTELVRRVERVISSRRHAPDITRALVRTGSIVNEARLLEFVTRLATGLTVPTRRALVRAVVAVVQSQLPAAGTPLPRVVELLAHGLGLAAVCAPTGARD